MAATPQSDNELREQIREIIRDKPYFMCRHCGEELFSSIGGRMVGKYTGDEDKANDEYLENALVSLVARHTNDAVARAEAKARINELERLRNTLQGWYESHTGNYIEDRIADLAAHTQPDSVMKEGE